jgi:hypothetical protein
MLIYLKYQLVAFGTIVIGPQILLVEAHAIKRDAAEADPTVAALLGILEGAATAFDRTGLLADIERRADVPGLAEIDDPYTVARRESGI